MKRIGPVVLFLVSLILLFFSFTSTLPASAQTSVGAYVGAELGHVNRFSGIAARFDVGPLQFSPSVEASFRDGLSHWQANADVLHSFGVREAFLSPYLGAGFSLGHDGPGSGASPGVNAIAGASFNLGTLVPFLQSRMTVDGAANLTVTGGLLVRPQYRR